MKLVEVARDIHRNLTLKVVYECVQPGATIAARWPLRYPRNMFCFVSLRFEGPSTIRPDTTAIMPFATCSPRRNAGVVTLGPDVVRP